MEGMIIEEMEQMFIKFIKALKEWRKKDAAERTAFKETMKKMTEQIERIDRQMANASEERMKLMKMIKTCSERDTQQIENLKETVKKTREAYKTLEEANENLKKDELKLVRENEELSANLREREASLKAVDNALGGYKPLLLRLSECESLKKLVDELGLNGDYLATDNILRMIKAIGNNKDFAYKVYNCLADNKAASDEPLNENERGFIEQLNMLYKSSLNISYCVLDIPFDFKACPVDFEMRTMQDIRSPLVRYAKAAALYVPGIRADETKFDAKAIVKGVI